MYRLLLRSTVTAAAMLALTSGFAIAQMPAAPVPAPPADAFFDDTVLHEIRLNINSRDWAALKADYRDNTYYPADFRWGSDVVRNIGIRSRGTGSRSGVKPGLRLDFDRYTTDQKFLGTLKSVVLRNNTQDGSGMHERISMLFFRLMGLAAPRETHARLYVNNAFAGLYTVVESVDKAYLQRVNGEDRGYLYKYEYKASDVPWHFDDRGRDPRLYVPSPFKPETRELDPRPEKIAEVVDIVNHAPAATFPRAIEPFIDLDRFIRHIAIEICLADVDGFNGAWGMNNFYLYRPETANLFQFIPWDKSEAFKAGPEYPIFHNILDVAGSARNRLTMRVMEDGGLRNRFLDVLAECARALNAPDPSTPGDARGWMEREVEREYLQIRDWTAAAPEDQAHFSREVFEQEVENLRNFARRRAEFVLGEVASSHQQSKPE